MSSFRNLLFFVLCLWLASFQACLAASNELGYAVRTDIQDAANEFDQATKFDAAGINDWFAKNRRAPAWSPFLCVNVPLRPDPDVLVTTYDLSLGKPGRYVEFGSKEKELAALGFLKTTLVKNGRTFDAFVEPISGQHDLAVKYAGAVTQFYQFCDRAEPKLTSNPEVLMQKFKPWTADEKRLLDEAFAVIELRAPELLLRACHNRRILLNRSQGDLPGTLIGKSRPAAAACANPGSITFCDGFFQPGLEHMVQGLAHELAHQVDVCYYWSASPDWLTIAQPRIDLLHATCELRTDSQLPIPTDMEARSCGLPSTYCSANSAETLAECVGYKVIGTSVKNELDDYVDRNILHHNQFAAQQENQLLNACYEAQQNDKKAAIADLEAVIKRRPNCIQARAKEVWLRSAGEAALAKRELRQISTIERRNRIVERHHFLAYMHLINAQLLSYNWGDQRAALEQLNGLDNYFGGYAADPGKITEIKVWALCRLNRRSEAISYMSRHIRQNSKDPLGYELRAYAYACNRQFKQSLQDINQSHTLKSNDGADLVEAWTLKLLPDSTIGLRAKARLGNWSPG